MDAAGQVTTRVLRDYHVPVLADLPRTEVYFAGSTDPLGPLGAKPMSEAPFNPVAPALANAVRDATGVRITSLPMSRDRVFLALQAPERQPPERYRPWSSLEPTATERRRSGSCTSPAEPPPTAAT